MKRDGFRILYATPRNDEEWESVGDHDLTNHLRERYWAAKVGARRYRALRCGTDHGLGRSGVGRERYQPGDDFRYSVDIDAVGAEAYIDWYEVTEVFLSVEPKDVTAFMRHVNGLPTDPGFDAAQFLASVNEGRPLRAQQRDAADKVLDAIERKLTNPKYPSMLESYGYGTLVVGLPLWFATLALNPLRPENAIDDFRIRTLVGLGDLEKEYLRPKSCPFGRVVVVWEPTRTAWLQWVSGASHHVCEEPRCHKVGSGHCYIAYYRQLIEFFYETGERGESPGGTTLNVVYDRKSRRGRSAPLPDKVGSREQMVTGSNVAGIKTLFTRAADHIKMQLLEIRTLVERHGRPGLARWASGVSPTASHSRFALRRRARRLYRASLAR